jgi:hypothetical protein
MNKDTQRQNKEEVGLTIFWRKSETKDNIDRKLSSGAAERGDGLPTVT